MGAHGDVAVNGFVACGFQCYFYARPIVRGSDDFDGAVVVGDNVFRTGFQSGFHQRVFINAGLEHQITLMHEVERYAAVGAQVAAVFGERMAHIGDGAGFVVGQAVHHQRRAADAVAFVAQLDIFHAFQIARTFVDGALHVVFGHIVFGGFFQSQAQARVGAGIAAAHAGCNGDFFNQTGEDFAAFGILTGFFMLDIRPLAMTCHIWIPFDFPPYPAGSCSFSKGAF